MQAPAAADEPEDSSQSRSGDPSKRDVPTPVVLLKNTVVVVVFLTMLERPVEHREGPPSTAVRPPVSPADGTFRWA